MPLLDATQPETAEEKKQRKQDDDDLELLLLLELDDDSAVDAWARFVPSSFSGLINLDGFDWDAGDQVYRSDTGTTINAAAVQRIVLGASHSAELEIERGLRDAISEGTPEAITAWQQSTIRTLVDLNIDAAAAGVGGIDNLTEDDLRTILGSDETGLLATANRLNDIASGLADGSVSPAQAINWAGMNAGTAHSTYQATRRASHAGAVDDDGNPVFTMERNILDDTPGIHHCDECPALTSLGWVPINTMPAPGMRECGPSCYCGMAYS